MKEGIVNKSKNAVSKKKEASTAIMYLATFPAYRQACLEILFSEHGAIELFCSEAQLERTVRTGISPEMYTHVAMVRFFGKAYIQLGHWTAALKTKNLILDLNPRAIHVWLFLLVRKLASNRTLLWGHLHPRKGSKASTAKIRRFQMSLSDGLILYTPEQAKEAKESLRNARVWVASNALYSFARLSEPAINSERNQVLYVGRFAHDKKVENLVRAFSLSGLADQGISLNLVGSGPYLERLKDLAVELGVSGHVLFPGWVQDFDLLKIHYSRAFTSVSPGFAGLGLTQSLGFGVPQIVSRGELHAPEIELADTGGVYWAESSDPSNISLALRELWKNPIQSANTDWIEEVKNRYSADMMARGLHDAVVASPQ